MNVIDAECNKTDRAKEIFSQHKDEEFQEGLAELVKGSYKDLFDLHGDNAWRLNQNELITFFRKTNDTSETIGKRQAKSFIVFAGLAGQREIDINIVTKAQPKQDVKSPNKSRKKKVDTKPSSAKKSDLNTNRNIGLTVRVEINLPADGSKETYDNIFQSIKQNLIDG